jgi:hypothetical protein
VAIFCACDVLNCGVILCYTKPTVMTEKITRDLRWRLVWGGGALIAIVVLGTLGYVLIE